MNTPTIVLICLLSALLGGGGAVLVYQLLVLPCLLKQGKARADLEASIKMNEEKEKLLAAHKGTEEFRGLLDNQYLRGLADGQKKALQDFSLAYTPVIEISDSFFRHTADAGYMMQIFYNSLPMGDPMKRHIKHEENFKDENMRFLIDSVNTTLQNIMLLADPLGIPVRVTKEPQIERTKR